MPEINLDNLTAEQELVVDLLLNNGRLLAYEDLLEFFTKEYEATATEDPYYGYYVKHVIETIHDKYEQLLPKE